MQTARARARVAVSRGRGLAAQLRWGTSVEQRWSGILAKVHTLGRVSTNTKVTPYYDTADAYTAMWQAVDDAKSDIVWQTYICKDDFIGKKTLSKLVDARRRGVEVTLLYDCAGNIGGRDALVEPLRESGGTVVHYRPFFRGMLPYFLGGMKWEISPGIRNHRKMLVVDGKVGFCGGLNVGDDYAGTRVGGNGRFRDTQCKVVGPGVKHLEEACRDTLEGSKMELPMQKMRMRWRQWSGRVAGWRRPVLRVRSTRAAKLSARRAASGVVKNMRAVQAKLTAASSNAALGLSRVRSADTNDASSIGSQAATESGNDCQGTTSESSVQIAAKSVRSRFLTAQKWAALSDAVAQRKTRALSRMAERRQRLQEKRTLLQRRATAAAASARVRAAELRQNAAAVRAAHSHPAPTPASTASTSGTSSAALDSADAKVPDNSVGSGVASDACKESSAESKSSASTASVEKKIDPAVQVLLCNPFTRHWGIQLGLWVVTRQVHSRLWVTSPYFLPNRRLLKAMIHAAERGVQVRVVAGSNDTTDPWFMWYATQWVIARLLSAGVEVYEYEAKGEVMHAKTVVADGVWASIGSYNWDVLSNKLLESCVTGYDPALAAEMESHFERDVAKSRKLSLDEVTTRSLRVRALGWFFYHGVRFLEKFTFRTYADPDLESS